MLTQADVIKAQILFQDRQTAQRVRDLVTTQRVALMIGEGKDASEIVLAPAYRDRIVADVTASIDQQIAAVNAALTEMGVEP